MPVGLAVLCVAQFVVVLDVTIVATALPVIGSELGFSEVQLPAVLTAYTVVLAGLLIFGGRLADLAGARRMFRFGLLVFAVGSLACAFSWAPLVLIVARGIQGVGAALLSPAALAALSELVEPEGRQRALGWWTAAAAGGGASGWVLGGVITDYVGWRWVFAVNVPIAVVTLLLSGVLRASVSRWSGRSGSLDLPGTATVTVGIALVILGLALVPSWRGWLVVGLAVAGSCLVRPDRTPGRASVDPGPGTTDAGRCRRQPDRGRADRLDHAGHADRRPLRTEHARPATRSRVRSLPSLQRGRDRRIVAGSARSRPGWPEAGVVHRFRRSRRRYCAAADLAAG